jgi:transposase
MTGSDFHLTTEERISLTTIHRGCQDKRTADRIKAIMLVDKGYTYQQIEEILLIDERTLGRYKKIFQEKGVVGLISDNYSGSSYKLSEEQRALLTTELDSTPYQTAADICDYVQKTFNVRYSPQGMVQTLHRLGYSYKKTCPIPGKADIEKQKEFIKKYETDYKSLPDNEKVYFLDGCHPTFNNHFGYAWIKKGTDFPIKTQDGRKHLNLMGAYDPKNHETVIKNYETLNRDAVIDFLRLLRKKNGNNRIHIIWDNVPYQHAKEVTDLADKLNVEVVYLPPYSPNLNLIERYWGFLRKKVLQNQFYETFEEFKNAILKFSKRKTLKLKYALASYIPEKFHLYESLAT